MPIPISMPYITHKESHGNLNFLTTHKSTIKHCILFLTIPVHHSAISCVKSCSSLPFYSEDLIGHFMCNMSTKPSSSNKTTIYILQRPCIMKLCTGYNTRYWLHLTAENQVVTTSLIIRHSQINHN